MLDLLDKDFKSVIINMFKGPKETTYQKLKESMRATKREYQKEIGIIKKEPNINPIFKRYNN